MSHVKTDAILVGLNYLEAVNENDQEMIALVSNNYSKDEIISSLAIVSMFMTNLVTSVIGADDVAQVINHARQTVYTKNSQ